MEATRNGIKGNHNLSLRTAATQIWPTATAGHPTNANSKRGADTLEGAVETWPTPTTPSPHDSDLSCATGQQNQPNLAARAITLLDQLEMWSTPAANKVSPEDPTAWMERHEAGKVARPQLALQAQTWNTPRATDGRSGPPGSDSAESRESFGQLDAQAENLTHGRRLPTSASGGPESSSERRTLNPQFVEWLMGLPIGWTGSGVSATEWSRWWRLMRSELSRLSS